MNEGDAPRAARAEIDAWRAAAATNRFESDSFLQRLLDRHLGPGDVGRDDLLRAVAEASGAALAGTVAAYNGDTDAPRLRRHDADGRRVEEIAFHPAYHEVGRVFWESGVLARLAEPGNAVLTGAIAYLLDQNGEAGHACPVACTAGAISLIQVLGTPAQKERWLPGLLESDYAKRVHAAQFVTEVQGGSDVGRNSCRARPEPGEPGRFRISGEKWFCSVADAGLFVVSARPDGAPPGTRGLGLFLVPRLVDGRPNGFTLRRLKAKLGTRSMATAEIEFDGALAEAIGPLEDGFRNLVSIVLDTSRVHNALAACGLMRRAYVEARTFAEQRTAFGQRIVEFPAVQEILARMRVRGVAALAATMRCLAAGDELARGGRTTTPGPGGGALSPAEAEALVAARRIDVTINKYRTSLAGTRSVRDGIEVLGGNGTIDDFSVLPRLYRDAIVLESWEGTHNTLCAQLLRDIRTRNLHRPWLARIAAHLEEIRHVAFSGALDATRGLQDEVVRRIDSLVEANERMAAAMVRDVADRMGLLTEQVELLRQSSWELRRGEDALPTLEALSHYQQAEGQADALPIRELAELRARVASRL